MTNHWIDLKNTDCALIIGSNAAENHPMSFKWLQEARQKRGAKIIHVDPRFNRTSSQADLYGPLRPGTDIAFIGGLINYAITNNLIDREYVINYTNASFLVDEGFTFNDGLFSGYDALNRSYDQTTWNFQTDADSNILRDNTLMNSRTVWQLLRAHFARYTPTQVAKTTGMNETDFNKIAAEFCGTYTKDKTGTIMYAMGATQHTKGSQNVRSYAILQLLLGNIGKIGGGINALRGESNVQGSTDMGLLYDALPGYLTSPAATAKHASLEAYNWTETPQTGYLSNKPKFFNSLLKAWYGPNATSANEFGYQYLPKRKADKDYDFISLFEDMYESKLQGLFCFGQNPLVAGSNSKKIGAALSKLKWLVAVDLWETETAAFWKAPGINSLDINTEVFLLPAASAIEKSGSITNSGRWMQYRWRAINPSGQSKSDAYILHNLMFKLKGLYATSTAAKDVPIKALYWPYGSEGEPNLDIVEREINGYQVSTSSQVTGFSNLSADGSTACGNWVYSGFYPDTGNRSKNRRSTDASGIGSFSDWGYAWPMNRRILYNRAAADLNGQPWSSNKASIWWDGTKWGGKDVPDFNVSLDPASPGGSHPFIMLGTGLGSIFGKLKEGPLPEHYEPFESPVANNFSSVKLNPVVRVPQTPMNKQGSVATFPIVATTFRVSEHWQGGAMTRNLPWLSEIVSEMFVEISKTLAYTKGIVSGNQVIVSSARGEITAMALVTKRLKPLLVNGSSVEQVALPWHWGHQGLVTGESANVLWETATPRYRSIKHF